MLSGCIERLHTVYAGKSEPVYTLTKEDAYVLQNGTAVSLWEPNEDSLIHSYRLEDGQELIEIFLPVTIDNSHVQGLEGAKNMEPKALEAALSYYDSQGLLLDIPALLEDAYSDYMLCQEENKKFQPHFASQETAPCIETERFTGFMTTIDVQNAKYKETSQVVLFDRTTGDIIPPEDLFTVSKEEALKRLTACCAKDIKPIAEYAVPLISMERVQWLQEGIQIYFYQEELPGEDVDWEVFISYDDLKDVLEPWAIPEHK